MTTPQLNSLKAFLRALEIPAEREARILEAARTDGAPKPETWISTRRAGELLGVCRASVFRYRARGRLHSKKRSPRCIRWPLSEVMALAEGTQENQTAGKDETCPASSC